MASLTAAIAAAGLGLAAAFTYQAAGESAAASAVTPLPAATVGAGDQNDEGAPATGLGGIPVAVSGGS